ncbi:hypothetical protein COO60DRAFT_1640038 [Scenedesmus sp. NREL 46B-D3]|nr:hypothetical protein COO60DRAFT_1640038 [Scenedesmus sp. NREL 46B-D3]
MLASPGTSVDISNGAEDAVSLQAEAQPQGTATASSSLCHDSSSSSSSSSSFQMQLLPGGRVVEAVERAPSSSSSRLTAAMPSRFCGVHVSTAGGSVAVGAVQEADLQLLTRGGAVAVRRCKANHAAINTAREPQQAGRGGSMQVGELSASVLRLSSGGGAISVQRLFALDAQLVSQGGAVGVGALYGVKVALDSCAGPLAVGHMSCSGLAMLQSGGAALAVEGLEGNASLISAGGDVKAWLNPAAPVSLQVAAGGGVCLDPALRVSRPPAEPAALQDAGAADQQRACSLVTGELGPASLVGVTGGGSSSSSSSRAAAAAEAAVRLQQAGDASPSALAQPAGSSFNASRLHRSRSEVAQFGAEGQPTSPNISQAWYPVAAVENLDADKPNKCTLLGKDYVLWADAAGQWHCFEDRCPHRLATLSDGLLDKQAARLCGDGKCTAIPQALDASSAATACASKRSCATALPAAVGGGLLWVWPDVAPTAAQDAAATEVPVLPQLQDGKLVPLSGRWMTRDLPYSWDFFIENVLDPTHVDFVSTPRSAGFDATKFVTQDLRLHEDRGPAGFVYQVVPSDPHKRGSYIHFRPPALVTLQPGPDPEPRPVQHKSRGAADARPGSEDPNILSGLIFYVAPTKPGWCRLHGTSWIADRDMQPLKTASLFTNAMPTWLKHILGFEFFAGDDVFLGAAAKKYAAEGGDWRKSYYLPTRADAAIMAMRKWMDKHAGGGIPFPEHLQGASAVLTNLNITPRQAMDRYSQHVQHCSHCRKALGRTQSVAAAALVTALAALAGACLAASVRAAAATSPAAVPGWLLGLVSAGGQAVGLAGPLLLLGLVAVGVHVAAKKVEQLFHYREFTRPAF